MFRWKRWGPLVLALVSSAFAMLCLAPDSPFIASEGALWRSINIEAPQGQVLTEAPVSVGFHRAALSPLPKRWSPEALRRTLHAAYPSCCEISPATRFESPTGRRVPTLVWWKHRRHVCQTLNTPPPAAPPLRTL